MRWFVIYILLTCHLVHAQNPDSLWAEYLNPSLDSTTRVQSLHRLVRYMTHNTPDSAMKLALLELDFAEAMQDSRWIAQSYNALGGIYAVKNDFVKAMDMFYRMLDIRIARKDSIGIGSAYNNIGTIYYHKGDFPKALEFYIRSLHFEEFNPTDAGLAASYLNIGSVYGFQEEYDHALSYFNRALKFYVKLADGNGMANCYTNIGNIYKAKDSFDLAEDYFLKSIPLMETAKDAYGMAITYANLGDVYRLKNDIPLMLVYFKRSEDIRTALDDQLGIADIWIRRGTSYALLKEFDKAQRECKKGLDIADRSGTLKLVRDACDCLYLSHKGLKQDDLALAYYERHARLQDSLAKDETLLQLQVMEFRNQVNQDSIKREIEKVKLDLAHSQQLNKGKKLRNLFLFLGILLIIVSALLYRLFIKTHESKTAIEIEKNKADKLLSNMLPAEITEELMRSGKVEAQQFDTVTILFTDIVGFTQASEMIPPKELIKELNLIYSHFDEIVARHRIEKIKSIGDAYMAAGGLLLSTDDSVKETVLAGLDIQEYIKNRSLDRQAVGLPVFNIRVGIHTGPVVAGIIGVNKYQYDVWGDTVNTASRMESNGAPGLVNISETTYAFIKDDPAFEFIQRSKIEVKGKGEMQMFFVHRKD